MPVRQRPASNLLAKPKAAFVEPMDCLPVSSCPKDRSDSGRLSYTTVDGETFSRLSRAIFAGAKL
jgi:hypothetical protein